MKTPVMERIMMTSMATARTLMATRIGRWNRLPRTSLFINGSVTKELRAPDTLRGMGSNARKVVVLMLRKKRTVVTDFGNRSLSTPLHSRNYAQEPGPKQE